MRYSRARFNDLTLATSDEVCRELGARLRDHRLTQLLRQDELAARAGVSVAAVKSLEQGRSSLKSLVRICHALGLQELLGAFVLRRPQSIAELERLELVTRTRAPRRGRVPKSHAGGEVPASHLQAMKAAGQERGRAGVASGKLAPEDLHAISPADARAARVRWPKGKLR